MRLIDADRLIKAVFDFMDKDGQYDHVPLIIHYFCDAMPTVDAERVTRCWECKYHRPKDGRCYVWGSYRKDTGFCDKAERKEE